jgi:hypothetical protein
MKALKVLREVTEEANDDEYDDEEEEKLYHWRSQDYEIQDTLELYQKGLLMPNPDEGFG